MQDTLFQRFTSASTNFHPYYPQDGETDVMVYCITPGMVNGKAWDWEDFNPAVFNGATDGYGQLTGCHRIRLQRPDAHSKWRITAEVKPLVSGKRSRQYW